ncbi:glycosyltransferase family 2 protein [Vibrio breoganii]
MHNKHLVSIIVPNFNNGRYLSESINSVLEQTYSHLEVIIVDDCSTDNSRELIEKISLKDERVKYYFNQRNMGVSYSRNKGITLAAGDYISTLDSDDVYYPDKIEKELTILLSSKDNKEIVAFSNVCIVDENLSHIRKVMYPFILHQGDVYKKILYRSIPFGRDLLISRSALRKVGLFNVKRNLYEDWEHKLKIAKLCEFYFSGSNGVKYRQITTGLSSVDNCKHQEALESIFKENAKEGNIWFFRQINTGSGLFSKLLRKALLVRGVNEFLLRIFT